MSRPRTVALVVRPGADPMPSLVERWARGQAVLLVPSSATEARAASMLAAAGIDAAEVGDCDGAAGAPHGLRAGAMPPEAGGQIPPELLAMLAQQGGEMPL